MNTHRKLGTFLTTGVVALVFLLGAGAAHAQDPEVILDHNGYVAEIKNLTVIAQNEEEMLLDVRFQVGSAFEVYGEEPEFDFGAQEENAVLAIIAAWEAINEVVPVPSRAGPEGSDQFFAGTLFNEGVIESYGAEYFEIPTDPNTLPNTWGECDKDPTAGNPDQKECLLGVLVISPYDPVTWARFTDAGASDLPEISVMPEDLTPATFLGEDATADEILVENSGGGTLDYSIEVEYEEGTNWISLSSDSGSLQGGESDSITVSYSTSPLHQGVYNATITVSESSDLATPRAVVVTLFVVTQSVISLSETMLMPEAAPGTNPLPDSFKVLNSGGLLLFYDVSADVEGDVDWMSVSPESGLSISGEPDVIDVNYDTTGLSEGTYEGTIEVTAPGAINSPQEISVVLTIAVEVPDTPTEVLLTERVTAIPDLLINTDPDYTIDGDALVMPKSSIFEDSLLHEGGAFEFRNAPVGGDVFVYRDWIFEVRSTCGNGADVCNVTTDAGVPWTLTNVNLTEKTAVMVLTESGSGELNTLAGDDIFAEGEAFATVNFVPEPAAAVLSIAALSTLGFLRLASRRRRR